MDAVKFLYSRRSRSTLPSRNFCWNVKELAFDANRDLVS